MNPKRILLSSVATLAGVATLHADTGTITISPSADTRIFNAPWGVDLNDGLGGALGVYQSRDRSLLRFDFGLLPTGFSVNAASLRLTATDTFGGNPNAESMNIYRLTQAWTETGVTWNRYDGSTTWATAGGDFAGTVYASSTANHGSGSPITWNVTNLAQDWASNTFANNGLIIINSGGSNGLHFASREHGNATYRPALTATITTATAPAVGAWTWNGGAGGGGPVDGAGAWSVPNLWWNGAAATWADGNDAIFGAGSGAAGTVTIAGTVAPKSLWFQATGSGNYTLDGGTIDLTGGVRVIHTSVDATINSTITNGILFKQGGGTLTLGGTNTHTAGTTIAGGTLKAASAQALGATSNVISVSSGASLDIGGQALQGYTENIRIAGSGSNASLGALGNSGGENLNAIRGITLTADASIGGNGGRWDLGRIDFNGDPNVAVNHIDGGGFVLTKVGSSDLGLLTGASNLAGFVVAAGRVLPHENTSFGAGPVTVESGAAVRPWAGLTLANAFTLNSGTLIQEENFTDNYNGTVVVNGSSVVHVGSGAIVINGAMSGAGSLSKTGSATLKLAGNNTQTGTLLVNGGQVRFASTTGNATNGNVEMLNPGSFLVMEQPNQFGPNAGLHFNSAVHSEFALYGNNQTIASLSSTNGFAVLQNSHGGIGDAAASSTLTVNQSTDTTYSGIIRNNTGNDAFTLALVKSGSGKLTLATNAEHTGGTTVNGGVLELSGSGGGNGRLRGTVTVNAGAELRYTGGDGTGFGYTNGNKIDTLNINGGLVASPGSTHVWNATVNMTGGELRVNNGTSDANGPQLEWGNSALNTFASADSATISGRIRIRPDANPNVTFTVADGAADSDLLVSAAITETGTSGITKSGAGTMRLTATSTYTGSTTVSEGTLMVDGNISSSSGTTVQSSGKLGGIGTLSLVTIQSGGTLSPGNSPGVLSASGMTLNAGSLTTMEIGGISRGTQYDGVNVSGALSYGGTMTLDVSTMFSNGVYVFDLFNTGSESGDFSAVNLAGAYTGSLSFDSSDLWSLTSGDNTWSFAQSTGDLTLTVVPEPSALLLSGFAILGLLRRRR